MVKSLQCLIPKNNIFTSLGNLYIISILYSYRYCLSTVYSYTLIIEILRLTTLTFILTCYTISRLNLFFYSHQTGRCSTTGFLRIFISSI